MGRIIRILSSQDSGKTVSDICREHGISQGTFYKWKNRYSGMVDSQVKQLKDLEKELAQSKKIVAELTLQNTVLKDVIEKSFRARREAGARWIFERDIPDEPSAGLHVVCISTSVLNYQAKRKDDSEIIDQLSALAEAHRTWGFWMTYHRLRKLQYLWNHKRVYRVYSLMWLNLRKKRKRRLPARVKEPLLCPVYPNVTWSLAFMQDTLVNGRTLRTLNVIDDFNWEVLSITLDTSLPSQRVIRELETLVAWRGKPDTIRSDNGPEFISAAMSEWYKISGVSWSHIQPGKPTQNSLIERFSRTFRHVYWTAICSTAWMN